MTVILPRVPLFVRKDRRKKIRIRNKIMRKTLPGVKVIRIWAENYAEQSVIPVFIEISIPGPENLLFSSRLSSGLFSTRQPILHAQVPYLGMQYKLKHSLNLTQTRMR